MLSFVAMPSSVHQLNKEPLSSHFNSTLSRFSSALGSIYEVSTAPNYALSRAPSSVPVTWVRATPSQAGL